MAKRAKKVKKASKKGQASVQVVGDGSNKVLLVFPKAMKIKGKGKLSSAKVLKLLKGSGKPGVTGECWLQCDCDGYCGCLAITAVAGVRG